MKEEIMGIVLIWGKPEVMVVHQRTKGPNGSTKGGPGICGKYLNNQSWHWIKGKLFIAVALK